VKKYLVATILVLSSAAYAGKAEREKKVEIETALKVSAESLKKTCGCSVKFDVKWDSYKDTDSMARISMAGEKLVENAAQFCTDADSKKALCAMKVMSLSYGSDPAAAQFKGGTIIGQTNDMRTLDWPEYIKLLDK
jgi:hypothetical protein